MLDGDDQARFLPVGGRPHHLYMWSLFDEYQILNYTMSMLPEEYACSSTHVPLVSSLDETASKKRKKKELELVTIATQKAISESMKSLVRSGDRYIELEKKTYMDNAEMKLLTCDVNASTAVKHALKKQYDAAVLNYNLFVSKNNKDK